MCLMAETRLMGICFAPHNAPAALSGRAGSAEDEVCLAPCRVMKAQHNTEKPFFDIHAGRDGVSGPTVVGLAFVQNCRKITNDK